ncbi:monocarboxylate transporter 4-like [Sinocyclocheilus rhinocerous]|uniref:Monocarboxylate transporter 4-like n=1 Tax=Sinocyclocheilus rhinocerous TaxID=307959 RepID=A0A673JA79_9TELE|nr:PREDICTED: monocarboxylate transporter 4-like [Sinocyclocheilus rhinocerous]XP_016385966.1 PREDICTED: monocarboxylate transporter 4-like [Sinocyclocheilus rhinocerous]XP_016385967.1 PREDICTED: monocarboxylate transporter 4-like [Sinocyclocheilus rhinocerous]XP_016385968.1 PREDICTED: monocarboxylate transporter 4-like [Sinocyclocheilus rhinocerous]
MGGAVVDTGDSGVKAPDGGWGWAVLFGCFIITGFSYAFPKAVSVFFKELIREFGVGYSDTAWISSILLAMLYGSGPICSILVNRFGCRPVMMVGGLFASLGMILASFATNIIHIYLSTGVITGLGLALNFQPSLIMLNRYFSEKRPLANGLAAAGSPVALCCLSPLGQVLQYKYGWRGGFLILGGILLNCCACGALMRPLTAPKKTSEVEEKETKPKPKPKLLDFTVFRDRGFLIYTVAAAIMVLGLFVPPVFVVSYAKELGNEDTKSALLLTILGFVDIFARPTCGIIAGLKWVRPRCVYLFSFAMIFNGITDIIGSMAKDYPSLVAFCIFFGISYGMVGALQFEVLMAIVGTEKFSSAIGLVLLVEAFAVLVGPPGAGRLLDATKNYMFVFLLAGCEVVLSALVLAICNMLFIKRKPEQPDPPAKMEMAVIDTEMEELNKAPKNDQDNGGGENGKKQAIEHEATTKSDHKKVEEPESIGVDSIELENASKNVTEPKGVVVEPESSL